MKSVLSSTVLVCSFLLALPAMADYTPTLHSEYQAVYQDGDPVWPGVGEEPDSISLIGVVVNNPEDMLDYSTDASSPQWQIFVQALPNGVYYDESNSVSYTVTGDYGGTALYMRQNCWGNGSYSDSEWLSELARINGTTLQYGDIVVVQAKAPGMFYNGKYNVNEKHLLTDDKNFYTTVIGSTTPAAASITLANLKDTDNGFIFDDTRAIGCEHYQASLVQLDNLLLVDPENWENDGTVTVMQGDLTFPMKLGLASSGLFSPSIINAVQNNLFSVTAILDQEDGDDSYYTEGYRLWLTNASNLTVVPEPGSLALLVAGGLAALLLWRRSGRTTA